MAVCSYCLSINAPSTMCGFTGQMMILVYNNNNRLISVYRMYTLKWHDTEIHTENICIIFILNENLWYAFVVNNFSVEETFLVAILFSKPWKAGLYSCNKFVFIASDISIASFPPDFVTTPAKQNGLKINL